MIYIKRFVIRNCHKNYGGFMIVVQVYVKVKEKDISSFIEATKENAFNSLNEKGIHRFDVQQNLDDPQQFLLTEIYEDKNATLDHKKTAHYDKWRKVVENMMTEPRYSVKYNKVFPEN
jgi:(4S)-4-hydroxy-5-phosphonooxypentane-2,3-dione isomerase